MSHTPAPEMPTSNDDIIDSRDVDYWINELENIAVVNREPESQDNLDALYALQEDVVRVAGWERGATLISDYFFEDYVEGLTENNEVINADELKKDYTSVEFEGEIYWVKH